LANKQNFDNIKMHRTNVKIIESWYQATEGSFSISKGFQTM